jgi:hypothetical protein
VGKTIKAIATSSLLVLLAACGGGGGDAEPTPNLSGEGSKQEPPSQPDDGGNPDHDDNDSAPETPTDQSPSLDGVQWKLTEIDPRGGSASDLNDEGKVLVTMITNTFPIRNNPVYTSVVTRDETGAYLGWMSAWQRTTGLAINNGGEVVGYGITIGTSTTAAAEGTFH